MLGFAKAMAASNNQTEREPLILIHSSTSDVTTTGTKTLVSGTFTKKYDDTSVLVYIFGNYRVNTTTSRLNAFIGDTRYAYTRTDSTNIAHRSGGSGIATGLPAGTYNVYMTLTSQSSSATASCPKQGTRGVLYYEV